MMKDRLYELRVQYVRIVELLRNWHIADADCLPLFSLFVGVTVQSMLFFFGKTCSPWPMWLAWIACSAVAVAVSVKSLLKYFAIITGCLLLTAFTFSYTGTDTKCYHFAMQFLMREGWNPVFDSTIEKFAGISGEGIVCWPHALFMQKVTALSGALVAKSTGLWIADSFLGYLLVVTLLVLGRDFARIQWRCNHWMAWLFGLATVSSSKITSFLAGQVDYTSYASFVIALFAGVLWHETRCGKYIVLWIMGIVLGMTSKLTGVLTGGLLMIVATWYYWRTLLFWRVSMMVVLLVFLIGAEPYLTSWIQYGSPLYPTMTFNPNVKSFELTANDFDCNADADSMGYVARTCYAWISSALAVKVCSWLSGNPHFNPECVSPIAGLGALFRLIFVGSICLLVVSKTKKIPLVCALVFLTLIFVPLKYVGYPRYYPQIWLIIPLSVYCFVYSGRKLPLKRYLDMAVVIGLVALTFMFDLRTLAYQGRMWVVELARQHNYAELARDLNGSQVVVNGSFAWTFAKRLQLAGVNACVNGNGAKLPHNDDHLLCVDAKKLADIEHRFFVPETPLGLLKFDWLSAFSNIPHPLFSKE